MKDSRALGELVSIGPAMLRDFERLGVRSVAQLARCSPEQLYEELCRRTGQSQDICVLDTFRAAVAQARLDEVVAALPSRLDTVVGEDGIRLSGGQRQRVAIARALYHDPPVLFFDEATAALDNQTEREVSEAIANVRGTRTIIAIAHRLSTVKNCDRLIYLRDGKLAGLGTYQELINDPGFRQLT